MFFLSQTHKCDQRASAFLWFDFLKTETRQTDFIFSLLNVQNVWRFLTMENNIIRIISTIMPELQNKAPNSCFILKPAQSFLYVRMRPVSWCGQAYRAGMWLDAWSTDTWCHCIHMQSCYWSLIGTWSGWNQVFLWFNSWSLTFQTSCLPGWLI